MNGWIMLAAVAVFTALLLFAIGFPRRLWTIAATALTLGATGYAWQGNPGVPGFNPATVEKHGQVDPAMTEIRDQMFGRFNFSWQYFKMADAQIRNGKPERAVNIMDGATIQAPGDGAVWTGLGMMLVEHDRTVSAPALQAFQRAIELYPRHPGPRYFLGIAYATTGQVVEGRRWIAEALALAPEQAEYRPVLVDQLRQIDAYLAQQGVAPPAPVLEK